MWKWHVFLQGWLANGYEVSVWGGENLRELVSGNGCTTLWVYSKPLNCTLLIGWILWYVNYILIKIFFKKHELNYLPLPSASCALLALGLGSLAAKLFLPEPGPWAGGSLGRGSGQGWPRKPRELLWSTGHSCWRVDLWPGGSQGNNECGWGQ